MALVWGRNAEGVETARSDWSRAAIGEQARAGRSLVRDKGGEFPLSRAQRCVVAALCEGVLS